MNWEEVIRKRDLDSVGGEFGYLIKDINSSIDRAMEEVSRQTKTSIDARAMGQIYGTFTLDISSVQRGVDILRDKMSEISRRNNNTGISGNTPDIQTIRQSGITSLEKYIPKYLKQKYGLEFNTARISGNTMTLN